MSLDWRWAWIGRRRGIAGHRVVGVCLCHWRCAVNGSNGHLCWHTQHRRHPTSLSAPNFSEASRSTCEGGDASRRASSSMGIGRWSTLLCSLVGGWTRSRRSASDTSKSLRPPTPPRHAPPIFARTRAMCALGVCHMRRVRIALEQRQRLLELLQRGRVLALAFVNGAEQFKTQYQA